MTTPATPDVEALNQLDTSAHGGTAFSMRAVERIVIAAIKSVPGTATTDSKLGGFSRRAYPRVAVQLDPETRVAAVDCAIAAVWPSPVTDVSLAVQDAVAEAIYAYLGYKTTRVNVAIGRTVPGERVSYDDIAARPVATATSPQVKSSEVVHPQLKRTLSLQPVVTTNKHDVRHVDAPKPCQVRSVTAPQQPELTPVSASTSFTTRPVTTPEPMPLKKITAPPLNPVRVSAPRPQPLRAIEVRPLELRDIYVKKGEHRD